MLWIILYWNIATIIIIIIIVTNSNERLIEGVRKKDLDGEGAQEKEQI